MPAKFLGGYMARKIIELKNISKSFDGVKAVDNLNLYINENEFITLLGPSGCGKTTTLRMIGGFEKPDVGDIIFNGFKINDLQPYERPVNTVFQRYALFPHLNVSGNIAFGLKNYNRILQEIKVSVKKEFENEKLNCEEKLKKFDLSTEEKKEIKSRLKDIKNEIKIKVNEIKKELILKELDKVEIRYEKHFASIDEKIKKLLEGDNYYKNIENAKSRLAEIDVMINENVKNKSKLENRYRDEIFELRLIISENELKKLEKKKNEYEVRKAFEIKSAYSLMPSKYAIEEAIAEVLQLVKLEGFEKRKIDSLSGGQMQRVAIARAIVNKPKILLLDEPLAALDLKLRQNMQYELKEMQRDLGITFIYVTHDQEEALTMSDTIVVMNEGEIIQIGTPEDIYNEPKNRFVASFIGESNIIRGQYVGEKQVKFMNAVFECVDTNFKIGEVCDVVIRPEDFDIVAIGGAKLVGKVDAVVFKGVHFEICVIIQGKEFVVHDYRIAIVGEEIGLSVDPDEIHLMKVRNEKS